MTGPEHYQVAERWLVHARDTYMDDSSDPGRREDYATEADYFAAVAEANEAHEQSIREAAVFAALGQAHATLAQAAATAMAALPNADGMSSEDFRAWDDVAGVHDSDEADDEQDSNPAYPAPGSEIPDQPGYVVGTCGHRVAGSEWRIGFRTCERCPNDAQDGGA